MNKATLQKALEQVKPGLASRELIEQSTSFAFMGNRVVTYNDEISISHPIDELDITGAVRAEELYKLLAKLSQDEIEIEIGENELVLSAGKAKAGLTLQTEIRLPLLDMSEITDWKPLPEGFIGALEFCIPSASSDMSRPILTCLHIRGNGIIEASDNFRLSSIKTDPMPVNKAFLLPANNAKELIKFPILEMAEGEGWVHFKTEEGTVFSMRIFEGTFPDVDAAGILNVTGPEVTFPQSLPDILERASIFARRDYSLDEEVTVTIENKKLQVDGKSEYGWFNEKANIKYDGEPIAFVISPTFLKDMLGKECICIVGEKSIKFSGENWEHVIQLREIEG
mgnify:CR=1 FL=1